MKLYEYIWRFKDQASDKIDRIARASGAATTKVDRLNDEMRDGEKASKSFGAGLGFIKRALAGLAIGAVLTTGVRAAVNLGIEFEQTRITFETMLGSVSKAEQMLKGLDDFANATPFTNNTLRTNAQLLLNFGTAGEKVIPTLKMLGDVSAGNKEKFNALTLAFAQAQSTGKLMGQDLLQMINAGFNPLNELAKITGKSMGTLKEEMSKGAISADMITLAFKSATSEGGMFFQMMEKQSTTVGGRISTFMGKLELAGQKLGTMMLPAIGALVDFGIYLLDNQQILIDFATVVGVAAATFTAYKTGVLLSIAATKAYALVTGVAGAATGLFTKGFAALNWVMRANPIGIVLSLLTALSAGVVYAYNKFDWFRGAVWGVWEVLKDFGNIVLGGVIKMFQGVVESAGSVGAALWKLFKGDFAGAMAEGKNAMSGLSKYAEGLLDISPFGMVKNGERLAKKFSEGYKKGVAKEGIDVMSMLGFGGKDTAIGELAGSDASGSNSLFGTPQPEGDELKKGMDSITGGGKKSVNVTVNLGSLIQEQRIEMNNLQEGLEDIEKQVTEALLRVINSANYSAAQ
jgi:tape measure domain-containing protein